MAAIGQKLTAPEPGWKRIDDTDPAFEYVGSWTENTSSGHWMNTRHLSMAKGKKILFNFKGTKLRIIVGSSSNRTTKSIIEIDGVVQTFSTRFVTTSGIHPQYLAFEVTSLANTTHRVVISDESTDYFDLDAIDIDEDGHILSPNDSNDRSLVAHNGVYKTIDLLNNKAWKNVSSATPTAEDFLAEGIPFLMELNREQSDSQSIRMESPSGNLVYRTMLNLKKQSQLKNVRIEVK